MTCKEIYDTAISLVAESRDPADTADYEERAPYLLAAFCSELADTDKKLRTLLGETGAEKLRGYGDMLYLAPGGSNVERVQGALVDDKDIKEIVKFVSNQRPQQFNEAVVAEEAEADEEGDPEIETYDDEDRRDIAPLLKKYLQPGDSDVVRKALEIVILDHKASTSYFQRRLKIGYNRAAEIADLFEERGIIGPDTGSGKPREILIFENEMMN